jgi:hypothetical protein
VLRNRNGSGFAGRAFLGLTCAAVLAACSGGSAGSQRSTTSSTTSSTARSTRTTLPTTTSTTVAIPSAPQPTADQAANALISDWASGDRTAALSVATALAVATLFAIPYSNGNAIDRGCATAFPPATCTFGPPGGGNPNLPLYSLTLSSTPDGTWYVSAVQVEG